jgi:hypothetical protein
VNVGQLDEAELRRHPDHELLGEPRQVHGADGAAERVSSAKSRSETHPANWPSAGRSPAPSPSSPGRWGRGAGQRGGAQRAFVHPGARRAKRPAVAAEHLDIGQQMVAEGHRLGRLQMGEAGHDGRGVRLGLGQQPAAAPSSWAIERSQASRTQRRKSVATWSLRERAVCSRPAGRRSARFSRASTFMWMSSNSVAEREGPGDHLGAIVARPLGDLFRRIRLGNDAQSWPAWRRGPASRRMSWLATGACRSRSRH